MCRQCDGGRAIDALTRPDSTRPGYLIHSPASLHLLTSLSQPALSYPDSDTANRPPNYSAGGAVMRANPESTSPKRSSYVAHWVRA